MNKMSNERGLTLLEGVISILVLSITIIGIYSVMALAQRNLISARRMTEATNFARKKLERIMDTDFKEITINYPNSRIFDANPFDDSSFHTDPDGDYTGTSKSNALPNGNWQVEYFQPTLVTDLLTIRVTVSWQESGINHPVHRVQLASRVTAGRM